MLRALTHLFLRALEGPCGQRLPRLRLTLSPKCETWAELLVRSAHANDIWQTLRVILCTCPGERVLLPDFDCGMNVVALKSRNHFAPTTFVDKTAIGVVFENYRDDRWGHLRLEVTDKLSTGRYFTVPRPKRAVR